MKPPAPDLSRRNFVRQACCAAVGTTGLLSTLAQLRVMGAVAADALPTAAAASGYKALVCLFLNGGNDAGNVLIPSDSASYSSYNTVRGSLAIAQNALLPIAPLTYRDGRTYGLNPAVPELQTLFNQGSAAFLANVGTLVQPTTLQLYQSGGALPPQLFSHADQQLQWQSSVPDQPFQTGWGGRLADLVNAMNSNNQISMSISVAGQNSFQIGKSIVQFSVGANAVVHPVAYGSIPQNGNARLAGIDALFNQSETNLLAAAFGGVGTTAYNDSTLLNGALSSAPALKTVFPSTGTAQQLQMIARLISVGPSLGLQRQIFFCQLQGWDTHNGQATAHGPLLAEISAAMSAFYNATVELGVASQVTTFTASDFGRTYQPNSSGTDHGWGNHQIMMGGAVKGADIYGKMPSLVLGGPDDTGQGRWIPSTSVDEYSATLATWFGVSATNLPLVLPNIGRFATPNLGFLG